MDKAEFAELFDLDGDGNVSQAEKEKAAKLFALVDKDGDGQLTEEYSRPKLSIRGSALSCPLIESSYGRELKQLAHAQPKKFKARNA